MSKLKLPSIATTAKGLAVVAVAAIAIHQKGYFSQANTDAKSKHKVDTLVDTLKVEHEKKEATLNATIELKDKEIESLKKDLDQEKLDMANQTKSFRAGAIYLKNKYKDFAYAFGLDGNEIVPLTKGINGGKVNLDSAISMANGIPLGPIFHQHVRISSPYGVRTVPGYKYASKIHLGVDFAARIGTPIYSPADGVVELARASSLHKGSGNFIRISHSFGFTSSYSHLSKFAVSNHQFVKKGDIIGWSGNTGYSTGPHVHYEIKFNGKHFNPMGFYNYKAGSDIHSLVTIKGIHWDQLFEIYEDNSINHAIIFRP